MDAYSALAKLPVPFQLWLSDLTRDADQTDLAPNLGYIPLPKLRKLWLSGCAPTAEGLVQSAAAAQASARAKRQSKNKACPRLTRRETRIQTANAQASHGDQHPADEARSDYDTEQDRRALNGSDDSRQDDEAGESRNKDESPER